MDSHILRHFLYLDTGLVDDWLASLEPTRDEKITETRETSANLSGKANLQVVEGGGGRETKNTVEVTRQPVHTDAARFQRLYSYFDRPDNNFYYEAMDENSWANIRRNGIVELMGELVLSPLAAFGDLVAQMTALAPIVAATTGKSLIAPEMQKQLSAMELFTKSQAEQPLPVVLSILHSPDYKVVAYLTPNMLRVLRDQLQGEASIFCKVHRKLAPGEVHQLFDPVKGAAGLSLNAAQSQQKEKSKAADPPEFLLVRSPAAIVIPAAIYR